MDVLPIDMLHKIAPEIGGYLYVKEETSCNDDRGAQAWIKKMELLRQYSSQFPGAFENLNERLHDSTVMRLEQQGEDCILVVNDLGADCFCESALNLQGKKTSRRKFGYANTAFQFPLSIHLRGISFVRVFKCEEDGLVCVDSVPVRRIFGRSDYVTEELLDISKESIYLMFLVGRFENAVVIEVKAKTVEFSENHVSTIGRIAGSRAGELYPLYRRMYPFSSGCSDDGMMFLKRWLGEIS